MQIREFCPVVELQIFAELSRNNLLLVSHIEIKYI
jgi:hypothetical protein